MRQETIENYLKSIYHLSSGNSTVVSNKQLAVQLNVIPATVTEALKKLDEMGFVSYEKSYGTRLTQKGIKQAVIIIRRHRIWETYLAKELDFGWDEVHELAEQLEHISSKKLIEKLAIKLGNPLFDPHGDPIPDANGKFHKVEFIKLSEARPGRTYVLTGVADHSTAFLKFLDKHGLRIGLRIKIREIEEFDQTFHVTLQNEHQLVLSLMAAKNLLVRKIS